MKKLLSILLTLSMLFSLCVFGASASNTSAAQPTEVTLHATNGQIMISWRNPVWTETNALTAIKLYDGTGKEFAGTSFDLTSGKVQSYTHAGLTTGNVYSYKLEFTYADGSVTPVKLSSKASKSSLDLYPGTTAVQGDISYNRTTESQALSVIMDNSEQRNGHPTLKLTNHTGSAYNGELLTVNVKNLTEGATYTFSYYQKASAADVDADRTHVLLFKNGTITEPDSGKTNQKTFKVGMGDWIKRSVEYTLANDKTTFTVGFVIKSIENFWIDELSLVEKETTTNKLANRANDKIYNSVVGFDTVAEKVIIADQVTNTAQSNSITTTWEGNTTTQPTRVSSLKFYIKRAGASAYTYAGETAGQYSGNFVFENLTPGTYYDVKVTRISCGVEVDLKKETINTLVIPVNPDWDVSVYSFKLGDTEVADISKAGTYTASVSVKNVNTTEASLSAQLIAAIYKEGVLQSVVYTEETAVNSGESETLTKEVTITDADCEVRLFLWDGLDTMKPLAMSSEKF
jgi:hypothetical protein